MKTITEKQIVENLKPKVVEAVRIGGEIFSLGYTKAVYFYNNRPCFRLSYENVFNILFLDNAEIKTVIEDDLTFPEEEILISVKEIAEIIKNNSWQSYSII